MNKDDKDRNISVAQRNSSATDHIGHRNSNLHLLIWVVHHFSLFIVVWVYDLWIWSHWPDMQNFDFNNSTVPSDLWLNLLQDEN